MEKLKQYIDKSKDVLYKNMDNDDYVSPNMLDNALSVINAQNKYIFELEKIIEKSIENKSENEDLQLLVDKCNLSNEKILSYMHYSQITESPRATIGKYGEDFKANYTVVYEDERWSVDV